MTFNFTRFVYYNAKFLFNLSYPEKTKMQEGPNAGLPCKVSHKSRGLVKCYMGLQCLHLLNYFQPEVEK